MLNTHSCFTSLPSLVASANSFALANTDLLLAVDAASPLISLVSAVLQDKSSSSCFEYINRVANSNGWLLELFSLTCLYPVDKT